MIRPAANALLVICLLWAGSQGVSGRTDSCGTQFYAQGVSKLFYGSSRSSAIKWSRTIKTNTVDSTGTRTIIAFYCFSGSSSCEPDDTTIITSNGDMFVSMPGSNKLWFVLNVCWPIGTEARNGPVMTSYQYSSVIQLLSQSFEVKVYREFYVDTVNSDTSELYSQLLSDSLGIVGQYDWHQRYYPTLLLGAVIDGISYGVTTTVNADVPLQETHKCILVADNALVLPSWVTSRPDCSITLYDAQGHLQLRQTVTSPVLDLTRYAPGVYVIMLSVPSMNEPEVMTILVL